MRAIRVRLNRLGMIKRTVDRLTSDAVDVVMGWCDDYGMKVTKPEPTTDKRAAIMELYERMRAHFSGAASEVQHPKERTEPITNPTE